MNWYRRLKLAQVTGEWWIDDSGNAIFADGEYNHESYVMHTVQSKYLEVDEFTDPTSSEFMEQFITENWEETVEWLINSEGLIQEEERQLALSDMNSESTSNPGETFFQLALYNMVLADMLKINGATEEEAQVAAGQGDVRLYAAKNWGWKRMVGRDVESFSLSKKDLILIANGIYDAYSEEGTQLTYNIFSYSNSKWYRDLPYDDISNGNLSALRDKQFVGW